MSSERLQRPVLVLNASYEPINICAARRALVLVLKGVASAEEESGNAVHSARALVRLPSVIRLLEYRRIPHQTRALSRKNILMRDRYTCQYCHRLLPSLQQQERQPHSGRGGHETRAPAPAFQLAHQPPPDAHARQERRAVAEIPFLLTYQRMTQSRPAQTRRTGRASCFARPRRKWKVVHPVPLGLS